MIPRTLFSDEHEMFREAARRFIATEITPFHAEWEKVGVVPRELWRKAGDAGLLCPNVPAEYRRPRRELPVQRRDHRGARPCRCNGSAVHRAFGHGGDATS